MCLTGLFHSKYPFLATQLLAMIDVKGRRKHIHWHDFQDYNKIHYVNFNRKDLKWQSTGKMQFA